MIRQTTQAFLSAINSAISSTETEASSDEIAETSPLGLVYFPSNILKKPCQPVGEVTEEIKRLARDMLLTMMLEGGVGLAAPQVGKLLRIFVVDIKWLGDLNQSDPHIFINPEIVVTEGAEPVLGLEGCLSFPGGRTKLARFETVQVRHLDGEGFPTITEATGFFARAIQHEMDHLNGKTIQESIPTLDMVWVRKNIQAKIRKHKREANPQRHQKNAHKRS